MTKIREHRHVCSVGEGLDGGLMDLTPLKASPVGKIQKISVECVRMLVGGPGQKISSFLLNQGACTVKNASNTTYGTQ